MIYLASEVVEQFQQKVTAEDRAKKAEAERDRLAEENRRLREALESLANPKYWVRPYNMHGELQTERRVWLPALPGYEFARKALDGTLSQPSEDT